MIDKLDDKRQVILIRILAALFFGYGVLAAVGSANQAKWINAFVYLLYIAAGIGFWLLKNWGRQAVIFVFAMQWLGRLFAVVYIFASFITPKDEGFTWWMWGLALVLLAMYTALIYFLTRPVIKARFQGESSKLLPRL